MPTATPTTTTTPRNNPFEVRLVRQTPLPMQMRARLEVDENGQFRIPVSSSAVLVRRSPFSGEVYEEILDHSRSAIDLSEVRERGLPILQNHNYRGQVYGRAVRPTIEEENGLSRLFLTFNMGETEESRNLLQAIRAGYYQDVSISWDYSRLEVVELSRPNASPAAGRLIETDDPDFRLLFQRWRPLEVSWVTVGADVDVGVGRQRVTIGVNIRTGSSDHSVGYNENDAANNPQREQHMPTRQTPAEEPTSIQDVSSETRAAAVSDERAVPAPQPTVAPSPPPPPAREEPVVAPASERILNMLRSVSSSEEQWRRTGVSQDQLNSLRSRVLSGEIETMEQAQREVLTCLSQRTSAVNNAGPAIISSQNNGTQAGEYSVGRAIAQMAQGGRLDGLERELHLESRNAGNVGANEFCVPAAALRRDPVVMRALVRERRANFSRAQQVGAGSGTGTPTPLTPADPLSALVLEEFDETAIIEALYARSHLLPLLSAFPGLLDHDITLPVENDLDDDIVTWNGERNPQTRDATATVQESRSWRWHEMTAKTTLTNRILTQSRVVGELVMSRVRRAFPIGLERAVIGGIKTVNATRPDGILDIAGLTTVSIGQDGGRPLFTHINQLKTVFSSANAFDLGTFVYMTTPEIMGLLQETEMFPGTVGTPIARYNNLTGTGTGSMNGTSVLVSNLLPKALVKGVNSDCHPILGMIPDQMRLAFFSDLIFLVDPYTAAATSEVITRVRHGVDFNYFRKEAFAAILDARVVDSGITPSSSR